MTLSLRLRALELPLRDPFVIARAEPGGGRVITTVVAGLRDDADGPGGPIGLGEGFPDAYYGETPATMSAVAPLLLDALAPIEPDLRGSLADVRVALEAFGVTVLEEFQEIPAEHYFDLTARFNATDNMTFTATVQNLFDNQPKVVGNTIGSTTFNSGNIFPATYDALGRRYAVSAKLKF